jgi:hypothetical protein
MNSRGSEKTTKRSVMIAYLCELITLKTNGKLRGAFSAQFPSQG